MTPEQLLERLATIRIDRSHGGRAPHKPLLLLVALGRIGLGSEGRLIPYRTAERRFRELWREFGRPGAPPRVQYPFGRLRNDDGLWEIPEESLLSTGRQADIRVSEARRFEITGGFRQDIHELLCRHPELVSRAAHQILSDHFPASIHGDILEAAQVVPGAPALDPDRPMPRRGRRVREYTPRDSRFRRDVLEAYEERCAVCEHDIRFGDRPLGLEAGHIRWHSHDGRDVVPNGLALCPMHHKALDSGALGLDPWRDGFRILISGRVQGRSPSAKRLLSFRNEPLHPPSSPADAPNPRFVAWHRKEVFHP